MSAPWQWGISQIRDAYATGSSDPIAVTEACLARIAELDETIAAFSWVDVSGARESARRRSQELASGYRRGPLHGVPIAVKELFDVKDGPADYGSDTRAGLRAERDAVLVTRLRQAGAIIVGTTRSHEFGWGITTQSSSRPSTRNPWATDRVPGGSSGGSAAAVAAGMVPAAIASDTGGSIRIPSAFCGVAGIKPTYGRVPRSGGVSLAPSMDTPGVITRHVMDLWQVLHEISGPDSGDRDSQTTGVTAWPAVTALRDLNGMSVGVSPSLFELTNHTPRWDIYELALRRAEQLGARIVEISTPSAAEFRAVFTTVQMTEAYDVHARILKLFPSRAEQYGPDVRHRIESAASQDIGDYLAAGRARQRLRTELDAALGSVDVLLTPISTVPPPYVTNPDHISIDGNEVALRDAVMGFTVPQNLTGLPSVAFCAGLAADGLPCGLQITATAGNDATALAVAGLLELELGDGTDLWPPLTDTRPNNGEESK